MRLAKRGAAAQVLERTADPSERLHLMGILVRDVIDAVAWPGELPSDLTRRIDGVRLYAPNMRSVVFSAPRYYFLTTDAPNVLRWMTERRRRLGATAPCGR